MAALTNTSEFGNKRQHLARNQSVTTNFQSPFRYNQFGFNIGGPVIIPAHHPKGEDVLLRGAGMGPISERANPDPGRSRVF